MTDALTAAVADRVRSAAAPRTPLRLLGAGTWLDAGAPCDANEPLHLGVMQGITHYEPGDLTLTARAGTSLAMLAAATRAEGQWLPLDPAGSNDGSIGATVATASAGPLAAGFGTPRDQLLGVTFVNGRGEVIEAGGRVVKNVAGFDLVRLVTGAWGTLGAITEVTVRLRALPECDRTLAVAVGEGAADAVRTWLRHSEFSPLAAELLSPAAAERVGLEHATLLLLRFGGNQALVDAAARSARALGDPVEAQGDIWRAVAELDTDGAVVGRVSDRPTELPELWAAVERAAPAALMHASPLRGVLRFILPRTEAALHRAAAGDGGAGSDETAARTAEVLRGIMLGTPDATFVLERAPRALWSIASRPPDATLAALTRRLRQAFDPHGLFNPGILPQ